MPSTFRAYVADSKADPPTRGVKQLDLATLPADGVLVEVGWSCVNYKDALASSPKGRVARISPLIPGVDLAGVVTESDDDRFPVGAEVIGSGYDLGVARHGGFARYARVPAEWLVPLPAGLSLREAMVIGTAGYTAALSVIALEEHGLTPDAGPVLVTGATGGVGSTAVGMLARRGYAVAASTGKADAGPFLRTLGAREVVDRSTLSGPPGRPLESPAWAAAVDCVGGVTLANVLARIQPGGAVAASGLTGGSDLPTTVMPFILRGVALLGIESSSTPIERRRQVWERLAGDLRPDGLDEIGHDIGLDDLDGVLDGTLRGAVTGRNVVDLQRA